MQFLPPEPGECLLRRNVKPEGAHITSIYAFIAELDLAQQVVEGGLGLFRRGAGGDALFGTAGTAWQLGNGDYGVPMRWAIERHRAGGGVHLLVRPDEPAD